MGKKESDRLRRARDEALLRQKGRCFYCKSPLTANLATSDHRVPASKGGTVCRENIAAACYSCNQVKADLPENYFFKLITAKTPPRRGGIAMQMLWSSRRIWRRTHKACDRINRLSFVSHRVIDTPTESANDRAGA